MARSPLEAQLYEITQEFVARIVAVIRGASFADVAGYRADVGRARGAPLRVRGGERAAPALSRAASASRGAIATGEAEAGPKRRGRRPRQSPEKRAELGGRILDVLRAASSPLGARAIASEVGLAPDLLAAPLRDLRHEGRVEKHGDKRATTYSAAP